MIDTATLSLALKILVALAVEIVIIAAGWRLMWSWKLHQYNFFRQLVGLPKLPKPKLHKVIQEERKMKRARVLIRKKAREHRKQPENRKWFPKS
mmetsp:Transcript_34497/g.67190  ORF Transcript_34497/g.67190 Transcript_34497/m.67190 type:complete len:94 (+) Transcript_34497:93-374(+)